MATFGALFFRYNKQVKSPRLWVKFFTQDITFCQNSKNHFITHTCIWKILLTQYFARVSSKQDSYDWENDSKINTNYFANTWWGSMQVNDIWKIRVFELRRKKWRHERLISSCLSCVLNCDDRSCLHINIWTVNRSNLLLGSRMCFQSLV